MELYIIGIIVFFINLPFGLWRSRVNKFSFKWFLAIHASIPIVYTMRVYAGIGWEINTFIILVGAYFLGQYLGSRLLGNYFKKA